MKYLKAALSVLLVILFMSGCSFRVSSTIDELISPISPFGDNADVKVAMDEYAKNGYSLKTPNSGDYISAYNFYDIDGDKQEEAIAFYEPSDNLSTIDMAIIKRTDNKWSVIENISGDGSDVHSLAFEDVNGDGSDEIIVCWDAISNSTNHNFIVYTYNSKKESTRLKPINKSITINNYIFVDMNNNGVSEALLFKVNSASTAGAGAELYSFASNKPKLLGETKLDSHITSYVDLKIENAENDTRVYADALGTDGASMLTELIYWSNGYGTIISPFYSYSTGLTRDTSRKALISSTDVNSDGLIEIPTDKKIKGLPGGISCVDWKIYKNTTLIHTDYSLLSKSDGYTVIIPDRYINKIKVSYDGDKKHMTVKSKDSKKEVFSIMTVLKATYKKENFKGYTSLLEDSGYVYLAKVNSKSDIKITIDDLKKYIKSI